MMLSPLVLSTMASVNLFRTRPVTTLEPPVITRPGNERLPRSSMQRSLGQLEPANALVPSIFTGSVIVGSGLFSKIRWEGSVILNVITSCAGAGCPAGQVSTAVLVLAAVIASCKEHFPSLASSPPLLVVTVIVVTCA